MLKLRFFKLGLMPQALFFFSINAFLGVKCVCSKKRVFCVKMNLKKGRFGGFKALIPLDEAKIVVESWKDIVIGFNGDPYRGRSRSVPSQKGHKSAKCWTLENVSFSSPPPRSPAA